MEGSSTKTYYELLGVDRDASAQEIKEAFRELARVYHPDSSSSTTSSAGINDSQLDLFKAITSAYHVLSNDEKRRAYDRSLPPDPRKLERLRKPTDLHMQISLLNEARKATPRRKRKNTAAYGVFGKLQEQMRAQQEAEPLPQQEPEDHEPVSSDYVSPIHEEESPVVASFSRTAFNSPVVEYIKTEKTKPKEAPIKKKSGNLLLYSLVWLAAFIIGMSVVLLFT